MSTPVAALGLVVPVFDEAHRFERCAAELVAFAADEPGGVELVFVDDGSTDGTADAVEALVAAHPEATIRLLRRPHRGKGAAVADGLRSLETPVAAFCDLDLATPLADVRHIARVAAAAPVLAIGSRDLPDSVLEQPEQPLRELLGRTYNRLLQATITPGVLDTQCGAKAARREVWTDVLARCHEPGFAWDAEVVAVCLRLGIPVREIPIRWRHDRESKVRVARDGTAMVRAVARIRRRLRAVDRERSVISGDEVFDDARAAELLGAGRDHWWFRSKAALVATALRRTHVPGGPPGDLLVDVGAGTGAVTAMLGRSPTSTLVVEGNATLARHARSDEGLVAAVGSVGAVPLADGSASVVCLLDVIEHLDDPADALSEARRILDAGGRLVVNVPAHEWLWSEADEHLGHRRRYTRRALRHDLRRCGFEPVLCTHVFSWLVAPVWLRRRLARRRSPRSEEAMLGLDTGGAAIDAGALVLTFAERALLGRASLPFGTSILAVAVPSREGTEPAS